VRSEIAFALMVVPATAYGTSLTLLSRPLEQASGSYGYAHGRLYAMNTLGAVAGTLLAEFALISLLGLRGTGAFAAVCNLSAAAIALRAARLHQPTPAVVAGRVPGLLATLPVVTAAFPSGGVLLALEVVWFRFLMLLQTGTTVMFAIMLSVVLAGLGSGGMIA